MDTTEKLQGGGARVADVGVAVVVALLVGPPLALLAVAARRSRGRAHLLRLRHQPEGAS
jgi:hypothetical protein